MLKWDYFIVPSVEVLLTFTLPAGMQPVKPCVGYLLSMS